MKLVHTLALTAGLLLGALAGAAHAGPAPCDAQAGHHAPVPAACVVPNRTGVQCAWSALETMARRVGVAALSDVTATHLGPAPHGQIERVLRESQAPFDFLRPGDPEALYAFLVKHVAKAGRPCAIGVYGGAHVLLCVHFEKGDKVVTLGNSVTNGGLREWAWADFLAVMRPDGLAYCLTGQPGVKTTHETGPAVLGTKPTTLPLKAVAKKADPDCPCPDGKCKCYPCECGPDGDPTCPCKDDCCPKAKVAPKVVMPNVTVARDGKAVRVYRNDRPGDCYVLPADASESLIDACSRRLDPGVYGPPNSVPVTAPQTSCPDGRCPPPVRVIQGGT